MKIIGTTFEKLPRERLVIGFEGENLRATVRIDCASVFAEYPNATPSLIVKPLFADAYPVVVDRNGTDVDWLITSEILSFSGDGEIQLVFYKDEVICKSAVSKIRVCRSLQVTGTMPDPVAQWIDDANRKLAEVDAQIVELEGMVDTATDAATRAEQSASTASTKAEQAAGSAATATEKATEATNAAGTATAKAAEAALSATQASNSAVSAADSERGATAKAGDATTAAGTATAKAEQATEAAQTATEKAGDASASARAAHASEINAAESADDALAAKTAAEAAKRAAEASATQAAQSAQGASADAQTATQKAAEAQQSATGATQSEQTATQKAGEAAASAQAASDAKTAVEETAEQLAGSLAQIAQNTQDIADHEQYAEATYAKKTDLSNLTSDLDLVQTSGNIIEINDAFPAYAEDVTAEIEPVQSGSGDPSPENIRPITGFDRVKVTRTGKNLFDQDNTSFLSGNVRSYGNSDMLGLQQINTLPAGTYTLSFSEEVVSLNGIEPVATRLGLYLRAVSNGVVFNVNAQTAPVVPSAGYKITISVTFTLTEEYVGKFANFYVYSGKNAAYGAPNEYTAVFSNIQLELGTTSTSYEPYNGIQVELPFGRTVYGGTIDLTTGKLTVTHAHALLNDPTKWVTSSSGTTPFVYNEYFTDRAKYSDSYTGLVCSYAKVNSATQNNTARWSGATSNTFGFNLSSTSITIDDIKAAAQNGEIEIMYPLATPLVYNLTPAQVLLLRDYNAIWANTGDIINLEYRAGSFVPKKAYDALKEATLIHSTASGAIASFPDGAEMPVDEVTVQINPVQDLHGYDHPWPAGGGKNLIDAQNVFCASQINNQYNIADYITLPVGTYTLSFTVSKAVTGIRNRPLYSVQSAVYCNEDFYTAGRKSWTFTLSEETTLQFKWWGHTLSADCTISDFMLESGSTATDYAPYSNICPISGFEGLTVTRTGKNFLNPAKYEWQTRTFNGITYTVLSDGSVRAVGTSTAAGGPGLTSRFQLPAGTYYGNLSTGSGLSVLYRYAMQETGGTTYSKNNPFVSDGTQWFYINLYCNAANLTVDTVLYPQIELGTTFTGYEPYQGKTYPITFPSEAGTVYGGTLTIAEDGSGVLTVDRAMMDMGIMVWNYNTTYAFFTSNSISTRKIGVLNVWSDLFKTMAGSWSETPVQNALWGNGSNTTLYVQTPPLDNVNDFMALVDGHQLMYELATPITYSLTASEITTLLGENNLWHNANGDISVGYKANTKLYIDNKIAELVARIVNS